MATTDIATATQTGSTLTTAAEQSLRSALEGWTLAEPLPATVKIDDLRMAYHKAQHTLRPASLEAVAVLLDRLWTTLPMPKTRGKSGEMEPDRAAITEWKRHLSPYPEDLLAQAVDDVVKTHKWETPPKIAQVIAAMREQMDARTSWRNKLSTAGLKAKSLPKPTKGPLIRDMPPEEREAFFAAMRQKYPGAVAIIEKAMTSPSDDTRAS